MTGKFLKRDKQVENSWIAKYIQVSTFQKD